MQRLTRFRSFRPFLPAMLLFFLAAGTLSGIEPVMYASDTARPGSVLQVAISGEPMDGLTVSLTDARERTLSRSGGFRWHTPTGRSISVVLLGIPSTAAPGAYTLVMNADQGRAEWRMEKALRITEEAFPEQVILMDNRMNTLYSDDSERKKTESRQLWMVLTSFDPEAQHHFGRFLPPVAAGTETAGFGDRRRYRSPDGAESASVHFGRDLWAESGSAITASGRGRVVMSTERFLTGNTVVIEHLPGVFSMYYHMADLNVRVGQMVDAGDRIGTIGATGFATGEHLHWEMRVGGTPVDPRPFLESPLLDTNALMSNM